MIRKKIILLIVLLAGVYAWYHWIWTPRESEYEKLTETIEDTEEREIEADDLPESEEVEKLDLPSPVIKGMKGREDRTAPAGAVQAAGRFHWLLLLSGPNIETESVLAEIKKIARPEILHILDEVGFYTDSKKQMWDTILVGPIKKESDGFWLLNTVAQIDGKQTTLYLRVGKDGDGEWKVWELLEDPLSSEGD